MDLRDYIRDYISIISGDPPWRDGNARFRKYIFIIYKVKKTLVIALLYQKIASRMLNYDFKIWIVFSLQHEPYKKIIVKNNANFFYCSFRLIQTKCKFR